MNNNLNEEILDKLTKTCICKSVTRSKIKQSIKNGAKTYEDVQKDTGAGLGCCKGQRCAEKIKDLIKNLNN
ncbi:(2Fe-2S)-binding protein [Clostridium weizhouense]|uniref:(2Fe-2S)-binding protein n=1 Tax=Clostridium weizhouense TaxID=2859781 RepID=A0ABS7AQY2_9CLOT|nr:(2Fe-2S)-binding protein [Clostridium weizhouense]MBW6411085.1 (2Fe-2S)-binding protein [Clostridium weizhouense]